jgi:hypothetical protein
MPARNELNAVARSSVNREQIEAPPELYDCSDDRGAHDQLAATLPLRKAHGPVRPELPEINAAAEPVVVVVARDEPRAIQQLLRHASVAAVVPVDDACMLVGHSLVPREAANVASVQSLLFDFLGVNASRVHPLS